MTAKTQRPFIVAKRQAHETVQEWVYQQLRTMIMAGQFIPGHSVTIRGVAKMLGVSPMPAREALRRLVAEGALNLLPNRRVTVPDMSPAKFQELCDVRVALETLAAERALPAIDSARLELLRQIDAEIDRAMAAGDAESHLVKNQQFHLTLYQATPSQVLVPLIENLWLQFGPFLRMALNRIGSSWVMDRHVEALDAIAKKDPYALPIAIEADIRDGMGHLGKGELLDTYRTVPES